MRARLLTILAAVAALLVLAGSSVKGDSGKKDKDQLQGTWVAVSGEIAGQELPEGLVKKLGLTLTIKDEKYTFTGDNQDEEGTIKVDPTKKPKTLDIDIQSGPDKGKKQVGIYTLEGDTWKLCFAKAGNEERPKDFKTTADNDLRMFVMKRQKKK
jgi:uncharacterized protein (TIGR03067 family)